MGKEEKGEPERNRKRDTRGQTDRDSGRDREDGKDRGRRETYMQIETKWERGRVGETEEEASSTVSRQSFSSSPDLNGATHPTHPPSFTPSFLSFFQLIFSYSPPSSRSSPSPLLFSCFFSSSSCFSIIFSPFSLSPLPHLFPLILFILSPPSLTLPSSHQKTNSNGPVIGRFFQVRGNEIGGERDGWWEREGG